MPRLLGAVIATILFGVCVPAWATTSTSANLTIAVTQSQTIAAVGLSTNSFAGGAAAGTVVGTINVTMSPAAPPFSGTLSLGGANASSFQIVGSTVETNGVVPAGTYQISIVAVQPGATGSPFTQSETITGATPACPRGSAYKDGCPAAVAAVTLFRTMLNGYAARPPWNVAGVDYGIGIPTGTTLQDPTAGGLPSGTTLNASAHTITVTGANVTLNGFDFGLHNGYQVIVAATGTTIKNSHFLVGTNQGSQGTVLSATTACSKLTLLNNEFDGANIAVTAQLGTTIAILCSGSLTVKYNYFHNSGGDMIDIGNSDSAEVDVIRYNLFKDIGVNTAHADTLQWYDSTIGSGSDVGFNTVYQTVNQPGAGNGLLVELSEGPTATMTGLDEHNNTAISLAACDTCNWGVGFYDDDGGTSDHVSVRNNYIDPTGIDLFTQSPWFATGKVGDALAHPMAMHDLTNMVTGTSLPIYSAASPGPQEYYVYPDVTNYAPSLSDIFAITASPASGNINTGGTVTFTLSMAVAGGWTVTGTPTLTLSDGGTAVYTSGSGTNSLVFTYTVGSLDSAANLAITSINLAGGTIKDSYGNAAVLSGPLTTFAGLSVNDG
jgi:hypothetical protein